MILGIVSDEGVPFIPITIDGETWLAVIDTGFNGDLELPEVLRSKVNPHYIGQATSALAGGQTIDESTYLVDFPFVPKF